MNEWIISSYCSGGACVQVRRAGQRIEIRDTRRQDEVAWFSAEDFKRFLDGARNGEFDGLVADVELDAA